MDYGTALRRVHKFLRSSAGNANINESAAAAAAAQDIIDRYQMDTAALDPSNDSAQPEEPIREMENVFDPDGHSAWRGRLALTVADVNGCVVYKKRVRYATVLAIVGRPSDATTTRYLYAYIEAEVNRIGLRAGKGNGRTWINNFRLGMVDTIGRRLTEQHQATRRAWRDEQLASTAIPADRALVRVEQALTRIEQRKKAVDVWVAANLRLRTGYSTERLDRSARAQGRTAGATVSLRARGGLIT